MSHTYGHGDDRGCHSQSRLSHFSAGVARPTSVNLTCSSTLTASDTYPIFASSGGTPRSDRQPIRPTEVIDRHFGVTLLVCVEDLPLNPFRDSLIVKVVD